MRSGGKPVSMFGWSEKIMLEKKKINKLTDIKQNESLTYSLNTQPMIHFNRISRIGFHYNCFNGNDES